MDEEVDGSSIHRKVACSDSQLTFRGRVCRDALAIINGMGLNPHGIVFVFSLEMQWFGIKVFSTRFH